MDKEPLYMEPMVIYKERIKEAKFFFIIFLLFIIVAPYLVYYTVFVDRRILFHTLAIMFIILWCLYYMTRGRIFPIRMKIYGDGIILPVLPLSFWINKNKHFVKFDDINCVEFFRATPTRIERTSMLRITLNSGKKIWVQGPNIDTQGLPKFIEMLDKSAKEHPQRGPHLPENK